jgi:hypothetical protein
MNRLSASDNPIVQVVGLLLGALFAVGAVLVGAVVLSFFIGFAVLAGLVVFIRLWWLRRRMERAAGASTRRRSGEIVEVEYTVVKERAVDERGVD